MASPSTSESYQKAATLYAERPISWTSADIGVIGLRQSSALPAHLDDVIGDGDTPPPARHVTSKSVSSRGVFAGSVEPCGYGDVSQASRHGGEYDVRALDRQCDVTYKVLLLGDSGVGKTALLRALTCKPFTANHVTTIGIDFVRKVFELEGAKVQLQIWDTAGQERFRSISRLQYRGTKGLVLVYDVTNRATFETLSYWMKSIEMEVCDTHSAEPLPIVLVANKVDLHGQRMVTTAEGQKMAEKCGVEAFFEVSAMTGDNVVTAFQRLTHAMLEIYDCRLMQTYQTPEEREQRQNVRISRVFDSLSRKVDKPAKVKESKQHKVKLKSKNNKRPCQCR